MARIIIQYSKIQKVEKMVKLISELLYKVNNNILRNLMDYKNDLLTLEDILKELNKGLQQVLYLDLHANLNTKCKNGSTNLDFIWLFYE